jgi:hypothetical protein
VDVKSKPKLKIVGADGNAFNLLGLARRAAQKAGMPHEEWAQILEDAMAGSYDNLLCVLMEHFDVE